MSTLRWLGIDSALTAFGVAVMEQKTGDLKPRLLECGTWCTEKDPELGKFADAARRIESHAENLLDLIDRVQPRVAFIESLAFVPGNSFVTGSILGRVRGMVDGVCKARGIALHEYGAQQVKRALCGSPSAEKAEVARAVWRIYGIHHRSETDNRPPDENATDAAAVAHVGSTHESVKYFLAQVAA